VVTKTVHYNTTTTLPQLKQAAVPAGHRTKCLNSLDTGQVVARLREYKLKCIEYITSYLIFIYRHGRHRVGRLAATIQTVV